MSEEKRVLVSEMGSKDFNEYDDDTVFVLDDPPLKNPLRKGGKTKEQKSE